MDFKLIRFLCTVLAGFGMGYEPVDSGYEPVDS